MMVETELAPLKIYDEALRYPLQYDDKLDMFSYGNLITMAIRVAFPNHPKVSWR